MNIYILYNKCKIVQFKLRLSLVYSFSLMISCWSEAPNERPHFSELVQSLEQAIAPLAEYMDFTDVFKTKNEFID